MDADKDWEARFEASEMLPLPDYIPELIVTYAPIPGPWWVQILASIGILALFGFGNWAARTNLQLLMTPVF